MPGKTAQGDHGMQKVLELNLESGMPAAAGAVLTMKNSLAACRRRGVRAVIVIHGYGSSGVGGAIKTAVRRSLENGELGGVVRDYAAGEQWHYRKKEFLAQVRELTRHEPRIANNGGVTVVLLA